MPSKQVIHVFGASGSGATTLARALGDHYGFHLIDTDDAIWEKVEPPFTIRKSVSSSREYLKRELSNNPRSVISGAFVGWGDEFKPLVNLFIYLHLPLTVRLERIQTREENRFGTRVLPGGDLYQQHLDFLKWVSQYETNSSDIRSQKQHEIWLKDVSVPVIRITEVLSIPELLKLLEPHLKKNS